jgi:hypothetical protein
MPELPPGTRLFPAYPPAVAAIEAAFLKSGPPVPAPRRTVCQISPVRVSRQGGCILNYGGEDGINQ